MNELFHELNEEENALLIDAIPLVTILIAGADGNIDREEKTWGAKLTKIRSYSYPESLNEYYSEAGKVYEEKLNAFIHDLPNDVDQRSQVISEKLSTLDGIFAKMDQRKAHFLYKSLTTFAEHVAKASGGFLRIGAISRAEKQWIELPMITPIEAPEEEEDTES